MLTDEFATLISNGCLETVNGTICCSKTDWTPHPAFEGVYLKHLIKGDSTAGQLSCHIVRVDPGCTLEAHTHNPQWEMHEVIKGYGKANLNGQEMTYHPGKAAVIPCGYNHSIRAGKEGLTVLAKFFPALV